MIFIVTATIVEFTKIKEYVYTQKKRKAKEQKERDKIFSV